MRELTIAIVAGETSGDLLGADLMFELKKLNPNLKFIGVGGKGMLAQGLAEVFPMERLSVMGLSEVLGRVPELLWRRHKLSKTILNAKADVFIGIDAPDFNLGLELKLRKVGIKTVHYVSPSVWAWRQKRINKIKKACDLMLTLLPFEADFYCKVDVPVKFVGHPLADQIIPQNSTIVRKELNLANNKTVIGLMPGSTGEISRLGELFLQSAKLIYQQNPQTIFVAPCANSKRFEQLQSYARGYQDLPLKIIEGKSHQVLNACDVVMLASGTATLEAMLYQKPMVVAYKLSAISHYLLKKMMQVEFVSLPNLLANEFVVPEFIQKQANPHNICSKVLELIDNPQIQTKQFAGLANDLRRNASQQAAKAVLELC